MKTGAQLIVECLLQHNVKYVFGIPGAKIDSVFNALLDSSIKVIVCRHEQNAAFMAAAYGRITGKPGVVIVTSGPGVCNLATGLLTATTEGDPVIAIGGNVSRNMLLRGSHQSTDNMTLMLAVTKARMSAEMPELIPEIIENAFRIALNPRRGAVFINLPQDVSIATSKAVARKPDTEYCSVVARQNIFVKAAQLINNAKLPILLLGMDASIQENATAIRKLLLQHPFPCISTYQASGVISQDEYKFLLD